MQTLNLAHMAQDLTTADWIWLAVEHIAPTLLYPALSLVVATALVALFRSTRSPAASPQVA